MHQSRRIAVVGLWCVSSCSLQNFEELQSGPAQSGGGTGQSGGASGQTGQIGGSGNGGAGGTISVAGAAGRSLSQAGSNAAGIAGIAGGGNISSGGTSNTGGTSNSGGRAGAPSCTNIAGSQTMTIGPVGSNSTNTGAVVLTVPLVSTGLGQRFNYMNHTGLEPYDLSCSTLSIKAYAPGALGGDLHVFFTTMDRSDSSAFDIALSSLTDGFHTITIPVPSGSGTYDPTNLMVIRVEVESGGAFGTSFASPATVVYIDEIWSSNGVLHDTFDSGISLVLFSDSGARAVAGATFNWISLLTPPAGAGGTTGVGGQTGAAGTAGKGQAGAGGATVGSGGTTGNGGTVGNAGNAGLGTGG